MNVPAPRHQSNLTDRQIARLTGLLGRLERMADLLKTEKWLDEDGQNTEPEAITIARQHVQLAYQPLQLLAHRQTLPVPPPASPQTTAEFLATPIRLLPKMSTRLWNTLRNLSYESGIPYPTPQDCLDNGLTITSFKRCRGIGKHTLNELQTLFGTYGVKIPL